MLRTRFAATVLRAHPAEGSLRPFLLAMLAIMAVPQADQACAMYMPPVAREPQVAVAAPEAPAAEAPAAEVPAAPEAQRLEDAFALIDAAAVPSAPVPSAQAPSADPLPTAEPPAGPPATATPTASAGATHPQS